jgi:prophage tail gpP-like protein
LISEVTFTLDDFGAITELVVIPATAFATEPEKKAKRKIDTSWMD